MSDVTVATFYPDEAERLVDGVVHWNKRELRPRGKHRLMAVPVECGRCKTVRWCQAAAVRNDIRRGTMTGRCRTCAPLFKRERIVAKYHARGTEKLENGVVIEWKTLDVPPPGVSGKAYRVQIICKCGAGRWAQVGSLMGGYQTGLCRACATSQAMSGDKNHKWKGWSLSRGYRILHIPPNHPMIAMADVRTRGGWGKILEHRLVAAEQLGRPLKPWEHVHHLNGIKDDNRPENLQVVQPREHIAVTALERRVRRLQRENEKLRRLLARARGQQPETTGA